MRIHYMLLLLLCTAGAVSVIRQRFRRLAIERRRRFVRRVRLALGFAESE